MKSYKSKADMKKNNGRVSSIGWQKELHMRPKPEIIESKHKTYTETMNSLRNFLNSKSHDSIDWNFFIFYIEKEYNVEIWPYSINTRTEDPDPLRDIKCDICRKMLGMNYHEFVAFVNECFKMKEAGIREKQSKYKIEKSLVDKLYEQYESVKKHPCKLSLYSRHFFHKRMNALEILGEGPYINGIYDPILDDLKNKYEEEWSGWEPENEQMILDDECWKKCKEHSVTHGYELSLTETQRTKLKKLLIGE